MSNRNFDASVVTGRIRDKNVAQQIYGAMRAGRSVGNPQTVNANASILPEYVEGVETVVELGLGAKYAFDLGGIANYVAIDELGGGGAPASATVPGIITVDLLTPDDASLIVSFTATSDGGSPITFYEYYAENRVIVGADVSGIIDAGSITNPFTLPGLTNGVEYNVKMRARNAVGWGPYGLPVPGTPATVPGAPSIGLITAGNQQLTVSFSAPGSDGGSPITGYEYAVDGGPWSSCSLPSFVITGLTNGTTYSITVRALNAQGEGPASAPVSGTPATVPGAPTILVPIVGGNGTLTVNFNTGSDGGAPITNYQYSTNNGSSWTTRSPASAATPIVISGLVNGITYQVRIRAINSVGIGAQSNVVTGTPVAPITVPSAPTALSGVGGDQTIYVLFTAGATGGSPITNYEFSIDGGTTFTPFSPPQTTSPVQISGVGLVNGTPYTVALKAVNAIGSSDASIPISVTPTPNTLNATSRLINLDANTYTSGSTWTNSDSAGAYSATLENAPDFNTSTPGNKYFTFNGTDQLAQIAAAPAINPVAGSTANAFTVQIWAQVDTASSSFTSGDGLISKQYGFPSYDGYSLSLNASNSSLYLKMNGSSVDGTYSSGANTFTNQWALYTIVVRFSGGSANPSYVYVSTQRVATGNNTEGSIPINSAPLQFPRGIQDTNSNYCPANVGAFYLYNVALSQEDIIRNYDATKSRYGL